ncbi:Stk1 family PASTA domain-containing Ser/Thr kinase [uncultured Jatrophihabitans sp.]|uniref:Stk1 family PASTA domain-containing Ser/Thr kinase n=1 Tax=uncultured Jatrophihabitans sp. TaxID=1610747 RepID=UPI0035C9497B
MTQPKIVGDRYELGELIGYGGMAEVHRGRDTRLNREVALKVLRADLARDPSFITRFRREAHAAAGLNHPSIVSVFDTGEDAALDGTPLPFIVMEFVEGRTLRDILRSEGRLPIRRAMEIAADICAALEFSHRNGLVHRDIKPANVMITPTGAVKVMDFGIARAVADGSATMTQTANVIGTAQYLSPEQARGEAVDARSDVYSTGCLLYELVTGVPPFQGDSPVAVAYQHVRENPVLPSARNDEVPRALDSIVMKALAKNQLNRYQSAGDMRADLQRGLANQAVVAEAVMTDDERTQFIARTPPPVIPVRRDYEPEAEGNSRRTGLIWAAVVIALLLVIGAGAYAIAFLGKDSAPKTYAVPDVIGQSPGGADAALRTRFTPVRGAPTNGPCFDNQKVQPGLVCVVEPNPGEKLKDGTTVTYHLYTPKMVQVPYVEGESYTDAVNQLHKIGLDAKRNDVNNQAPAGTVLKQHTAQFTPVTPRTVIALDVSTGKLKLPNVKGKDFDKAQSTLNDANFPNVVRGDTVTTANPKKDGEVAAESPQAGRIYDPSQKITLDVYKYVAPAPTCTSAPATPSSPTVPTAPSSPGTGTSSSAGLPPCSSSSSSSSSR